MKHLNLNKITIIIILLILITITNIPMTNAAVDVTDETEIYSSVTDDDETYELRPLYNDDDQLQYFVVDFSNNGYMYIKIVDEEKYYLHSLYIRSVGEGSWSKVVDVINGQMIYETDESGNPILYCNSHFKAANIPSDTRGYLIKTIISNALVPSIKVGDNYLDLITMQEYDGVFTYKQHYSGIYFSSIPHFRL